MGVLCAECETTGNKYHRLDTFAWTEIAQRWFVFQVDNGVEDFEAQANCDLGLAPEYADLWRRFLETPEEIARRKEETR